MQGLLSGFIPGAITLIGTNTPTEKVGYALSHISSAAATGMILGPLLGGGMAELVGNRLAFGTAGIIVGLATVLIIFWVKEENFKPRKEKGSIRKDFSLALQNRPFFLVLILTLIVSCSIMTLEPILPLHISNLGEASQYQSLLTGFVISLPGIASALFAPRWGKWADKVGFQRVLFIGLIGGAIGTLAQILFSGIIGFSIARFVYGIFFCSVFPALNGLVVQSTPEEFRGRAFSLNQTSTQIGAMIGPIMGGFLGGIFPVQVLFLLTGVLLITAILTAYWNADELKIQAKKQVIN
jgi:MFS transporter, DHA1 family, multidrug resistance protein